MEKGGEHLRKEATKQSVKQEKKRLQREYEQKISDAYLTAHIKHHYTKLDKLKEKMKMYYENGDRNEVLETQALIGLLSWEASIIHSYVSKNSKTDFADDKEINDLIEDLEEELADARENAEILLNSQ